MPRRPLRWFARMVTVGTAVAAGLVLAALPALATEGGAASGDSPVDWDGMILAVVLGVFAGIAVVFSSTGAETAHHQEETA